MTRLVNNTKARRSRNTFNLRKAYLDTVVPFSEYDNFYDSSLVRFYGKVNLNGDIVYPSEKYLSVLPNPNKSSGKTYYALNFVAQAFTDFRDYYVKGINAGVVKGDNPNIIEPTRGWQSMHDLYARNINNLYSSIVNKYLQNPTEALGVKNSYPKDFDEFVRSVNQLFTSQGKKVKLSRSSFILSRACPMSVTGLAIEITPFIGYNNDKKKAKDFYQDPNFKFYMQSLKKFGFMADVDYPGRIVADLGSPIMQEYMSQFDVAFENLFDTYYYKASDYDYELIRIYFIQFYNNYVADYPIRSVVKKSGGVSASKYSIQANNFRARTQPIPVPTLKIACEESVREIVKRSMLTKNDLDSKYDTTYWITQYAKVLNYELNNVYSGNSLDKIIKNAQDLNKSIDIDTAKSYINEAYKTLRHPTKMMSEKRTSTSPAQTSTPTSGGSSGGGGGY